MLRLMLLLFGCFTSAGAETIHISGEILKVKTGELIKKFESTVDEPALMAGFLNGKNNITSSIGLSVERMLL